MSEKSAAARLQLSRRIERDGMARCGQWSIRVASIVFALIVGGLLLLALGYYPAEGLWHDHRRLARVEDVRHPPDHQESPFPCSGLRAGHRPVLQDALLEHRRRGPDHRRRHRARRSFALKFWARRHAAASAAAHHVRRRRSIVRRPVGPRPRLLQGPQGNTNETLFTLMMNYIIIGVVKWLQGGPWEKLLPPAASMIAQFAANAKPAVRVARRALRLDRGARALTVLMFLYMRYTKHGYEIAVIGERPATPPATPA